MPEKLQHYANHRARDPEMAVFGVLAVVACALAVAGIWTWGAGFASVLLTVAVFLQALCFLWLLLKLRRYVLRTQDRIIRLEMRLRLEQILPANLRGRIPELTLHQLIALRFASDGELPELTDKVLTDNIQSQDAIKRLIKNWQPDFLRI